MRGIGRRQRRLEPRDGGRFGPIVLWRWESVGTAAGQLPLSHCDVVVGVCEKEGWGPHS